MKLRPQTVGKPSGAQSAWQTPQASVVLINEFFGEPLAGAAQGAASGSLSLVASVAGRAVAQGQASGTFALTASAAGVGVAQGAASGTLALGASATGNTEGAAVQGAASGILSLSGSVAGQAVGQGAISDAFSLFGNAAGRTVAQGGVAGTLALLGVAAGTTDGQQPATPPRRAIEIDLDGIDPVVRKLLQPFQAPRERKQAAKALPRLPVAQQTAIKKRMAQVAAEGARTIDDVTQALERAARDAGTQATPVMLDWAVYYLKVSAYKMAQVQTEEEELLLLL
ncbi:MAG: hypothetical protein ACRCWJ_11610 [Casimicrobium sp.]